ncbi:hypothetical protein LY78DRAFT_384325 [Colletotrichum sublineola]|nr:hypothetical protein LY78DRAFT_384325 [Colletotrichum sublineola]
MQPRHLQAYNHKTTPHPSRPLNSLSPATFFFLKKKKRERKPSHFSIPAHPQQKQDPAPQSSAPYIAVAVGRSRDSRYLSLRAIVGAAWPCCGLVLPPFTFSCIPSCRWRCVTCLLDSLRSRASDWLSIITKAREHCPSLTEFAILEPFHANPTRYSASSSSHTWPMPQRARPANSFASFSFSPSSKRFGCRKLGSHSLPHLT